MSSQKVLKEEIVTVKKAITGRMSYTFFTSAEHGDVFVHVNNLIYDDFDPSDLCEGGSAVIDIVIRPDGRNRTAKIHQISSSSSSSLENLQTKKGSTQKKKSTWFAGMSSQGKVKILQQGFGFVKKPGYTDLFFAMSCVEPGLTAYLEEGSVVRFVVETCERGIMARIEEIVWPESQLTRSVVDFNEKTGKYIHRVTDPTGASVLEVRDGKPGSKSKLLDKPKNLLVAKNMIGNNVLLRVVTNSAQQSRS